MGHGTGPDHTHRGASGGSKVTQPLLSFRALLSPGGASDCGRAWRCSKTRSAGEGREQGGGAPRPHRSFEAGGACQLGSGRSGWAEPSGTPITENRTRQSGGHCSPASSGDGATWWHYSSHHLAETFPSVASFSMKTGRLSVAASAQLGSSTGTHSRVTTSAVFGVELHFPRGCGPYVPPRDRQLGLTDAAVCSLPTWEPPRLS